MAARGVGEGDGGWLQGNGTGNASTRSKVYGLVHSSIALLHYGNGVLAARL